MCDAYRYAIKVDSDYAAQRVKDNAGSTASGNLLTAAVVDWEYELR